MNDYQVVIEAGESIHLIPPNITVSMKNEAGHIDNIVVIYTVMQDEGYEAEVPRKLRYSCTIQSHGLQDAFERAVADIGEVHRTLSFVANCHGGNLVPYVAYEKTAGKARRRFWQAFTPSSPLSFPRTFQYFPSQLFLPVLTALNQLPESFKHNVLMAMDQYVFALSHWGIGSKIVCVAHLFQSAEALTIAYTKLCMELHGLSNKCELLARIAPKNEIRLEPWIRKHVVFQGDLDTHRSAKELSDMFEHGYGRLDEMRAHGYEVRDKAARIIRGSILDILDLSADTCDQLMSDNLNSPRPDQGWIGAYDGYIVGDSPDVAPAGSFHPYVELDNRASGFTKTETGYVTTLTIDDEQGYVADGLEMERRQINFSETGGYMFLRDEDNQGNGKG